MIFDANCVGATCTGGDSDLSAPSLGKILIYSEDGDSGDPDDCFCSPTFTFNFTGLGTGSITPESIVVMDAESAGGSVTLHDSSGVLGSVPIPAIGDGAMATVSLAGFSEVTMIVVSLVGSGALDNLAFSATSAPPPPPPPPGPIPPPSGQLRIEKSIVSADGGMPDNPASPSLAGFEFEISNASNVVVRTVVTDLSGIALTVGSLSIGTYTIAETDSQGLTDLTGTTTIFLSAGLNIVTWVNQQPIVMPGVDIELATNVFDADLSADAVEVEFDSGLNWTMVVTNTGDAPLTNVTVIGPDINSDTELIIEGIDLAPGETATFESVDIADEGLVRKLAEVTTDEGVSDSDPSHYNGIVTIEPDNEVGAPLPFGSAAAVALGTVALMS